MSIGERIKERRIALGISQRKLADLMGYTNHSTIARIETGSVDIPQSKIVKFSEVLMVPISWLMCWDDEEPAIPPQRDEIADLLEGATDQQKREIVRYIKFILNQEE